MFQVLKQLNKRNSSKSLSKMIGINSVDIDYQMNEIRVEFDTPANLNNIKKKFTIADFVFYN